MAQSRFVSYSPMGQEDRFADLDGKCGVLIISKRSDLVVTVLNAPNAQIIQKGQSQVGLYEYEVIIDKDETPNPKIDVSRRGDVNRATFVAKIKPDYFRAYLIDEVEKPITMEDQTAGNDAILDASLAEVEISSAIPNLQVECNPALGTKMSVSRKKGDESISIVSVKIPIANIQNAKEKVQRLRAQHEELQGLIFSGQKKADEDFVKLDQLEEDVQKAEQALTEMCLIDIYAQETNHLSISVMDMSPRTKMCYGVLALKTIIREHVSKCSGFLEEGGRLFASRKYGSAKTAFQNALNAEDTPEELKPAINTNIAQCDTCSKYETYLTATLVKVKEMKAQNDVTQERVAQYYSAAIDFLNILNKYNPCNLYTNGISNMETQIANMPIAIRFTITKWISDRITVSEAGPCPGVQIWAYKGNNTPALKGYSSYSAFKKLVSEDPSSYLLMGTSENDGVIELEFSRSSMPTGLFFIPVGGDKKIQNVYKNVEAIMQQSKGEFNKRQFRLKLYIKK